MTRIHKKYTSKLTHKNLNGEDSQNAMTEITRQCPERVLPDFQDKTNHATKKIQKQRSLP